jgi:PhoH-like ATPase
MPKTFVLDTNVLLHNPHSIESFADNVVILPMAVIEELDKFKTRGDELGRNAREVIRRLDAFRKAGRLGEGVEMENGGRLRIVVGHDGAPIQGLDPELADNRIVRLAYGLQTTGERVIFVSKDINARLKADALGIEVMDFEKEKVNFDELFTGYREVDVPAATVDGFYQTDILEVPEAAFQPNEFVLLRDITNPKHSALARALDDIRVAHLNARFERAWNIRPRSKEQRMAFELLLDPEVQLVTLVGQAGTGKTLLALAAGLEMVQRFQKYDRLLVSRPIIPLGKDIGYLPGAKDEKLSHWMQPIFDNLAYLMYGGNGHVKDKHRGSVRQGVEELLKEQAVELEALTYIRGRSIPRQYVVIDEAQNLTPHEIKTIVSRAGEGTKMVLTGDPYQIDNPYLDSASNGLAYAVERLKSHAISGHITLKKSERSPLAAVAAERL